MGKIRTRVLGNEEVEEKQKKEQKERAKEKKVAKAKESKESASVKTTADKGKKDEVKEQVAHTDTAGKEKKSKTTNSDKSTKVKHVRGKKYQKAAKMVDSKKAYILVETIPLLKKTKYASFDESVELHLNVDETGFRGEVSLPHTTGKSVRVAIVSDVILAEIDKGVLNFDVLITHPSFMPKLAKYARVLGPKGLMPNPKAGTISPNPEEVAKKFQGGSLRWKSEAKFPLVHQMIGKISHDEKALVENAAAFLNAVGKNHIKEAFIKTTMSPSLKIDIEKI